LSLFDTDILSAKARQAGFSLAVCRDIFVHHFGTRTFMQTAPKVEERRWRLRRVVNPTALALADREYQA
jgi:hypothetical protein